PLLRAQEQLEAAERRRKDVRDDAQAWGVLAGDGTGDVTPEQLEKVAGDIRRSHGARQRLENLERSFDWVDEQKHGLEEAANAMKARAVQLLETAGIADEPARG